MVNPLNIYSITNLFEANNVANKGLMEIGGYAVPGVVMANNKVEARERAEKAGLAFGFSFLAPLVFLPLLNRAFLKGYGVSKALNTQEAQIMRLSKKYLAKDADYMLKGINELKAEFKETHPDIQKAFDGILKNFNTKEKQELLRQKLIGVNDKIMLCDFLLTGSLMGSIYWISNAITKKKTGRDGFSAEYKMAEKGYVEGKAQKYKKEHDTNILKAAGILALGAISLSTIFRKGMKAEGQNLIKKHAAIFDYKEGIYMSRAILLLITLFGDIPNTLLASRDKEELKYNTIKNGVVYGTFFGGDLILNNIVARIIDKTCKDINLVNKDDIGENPSLWKKLSAPLYTLKQIENKNLAPDLMKKTKAIKTAMFWANFAAVTAFMGFGTPYFLNKMVRKKVEQDTKTKS